MKIVKEGGHINKDLINISDVNLTAIQYLPRTRSDFHKHQVPPMNRSDSSDALATTQRPSPAPVQASIQVLNPKSDIHKC